MAQRRAISRWSVIDTWASPRILWRPIMTYRDSGIAARARQYVKSRHRPQTARLAHQQA